MLFLELIKIMVFGILNGVGFLLVSTASLTVKYNPVNDFIVFYFSPLIMSLISNRSIEV